VRQTVFDGQSQEPPPTIKTEPSRSTVAERLAEAHQLVARKKARAKTTARRKRRS